MMQKTLVSGSTIGITNRTNGWHLGACSTSILKGTFTFWMKTLGVKFNTFKYYKRKICTCQKDTKGISKVLRGQNLIFARIETKCFNFLRGHSRIPKSTNSQLRGANWQTQKIMQKQRKVICSYITFTMQAGMDWYALRNKNSFLELWIVLDRSQG